VPWKQRPASGWNWLCPVCHSQTLVGTFAVCVCCWKSYALDATKDYVDVVMSRLPQDELVGVDLDVVRSAMLFTVRASLSVHPLFKDRLIIDVKPERHRPYHEHMAQAIAMYGKEKNTAPVVSGERTGDEGSRQGTPHTGRPTGPVIGHDTLDDHEEGQERAAAATEEKERGPEATVNATLHGKLILSSLGPVVGPLPPSIDDE
jgi:hypothetical protein